MVHLPGGGVLLAVASMFAQPAGVSVAEWRPASGWSPWAPLTAPAVGEDGYPFRGFAAATGEGDHRAVVWTAPETSTPQDEDEHLVGAYTDETGGWSVPSGAGGNVDQRNVYPDVAVGRGGEVVAVFGVGGSLHAVTSAGSRGFNYPRPVGDHLVPYSTPAVAADPTGLATAAWLADPPTGPPVIRIAERPLAGDWTPGPTLSPGDDDLRGPLLEAAPDGGRVIAWRIGDRLWAATRAPGGGWTPAVAVTPPGYTALYFGVGAGRGGRAAVIWGGSSAGTTGSHVSLFTPGVGWSSPTRLSTAPLAFAPGGDVAFDDRGNVVALWDRNGAVASVLDATPPAVDAQVPAAVTADDPVTLTARVSDDWSTVGPPRWTFPDGSTATGDAVSHVFSGPGTQRVTVTATDAAGNATSVERTTRVLPYVRVDSPPVAFGSWRRGRYVGGFTVSGRTRGGGALVATVRAVRGPVLRLDRRLRAAPLMRRTVTLPDGDYRIRVPLPRTVLPGTYRLTLTRPDGASTSTLVVPPPRQGILGTASANVSPGPGGRGTNLLARFTFAVRPEPTARITTQWVPPRRTRERFGRISRRIAGGRVLAPLGAGGRLPQGTWRCVLRVDGVVVGTATVGVSYGRR
jgi:hypothetical protein